MQHLFIVCIQIGALLYRHNYNDTTRIWCINNKKRNKISIIKSCLVASVDMFAYLLYSKRAFALMTRGDKFSDFNKKTHNPIPFVDAFVSPFYAYLWSVGEFTLFSFPGTTAASFDWH